MAAGITHIVLAEKIFAKYFCGSNKKEFLIGTIFPDIRYLGVIGREKTHFHDMTLVKAQKEKDSFLAGMKIHSLIDWLRVKFLRDKLKNPKFVKQFLTFKNSSVVLKQIDDSKINSCLKLLEDEMFYPKSKNWSEYIEYIEDILPQELNFGITENDVQRWHERLINYFSQPPNEISRKEILIAQGFSENEINLINQIISELRNNSQIKETIEKLYKFFC